MSTEFIFDRRPFQNGRQSAPEERLLTIGQAAERSSVNRKVIDKAIREEELQIVIMGPKSDRIRLAELQRWWKRKEVGFD